MIINHYCVFSIIIHTQNKEGEKDEEEDEAEGNNCIKIDTHEKWWNENSVRILLPFIISLKKNLLLLSLLVVVYSDSHSKNAQLMKTSTFSSFMHILLFVNFIQFILHAWHIEERHSYCTYWGSQFITIYNNNQIGVIFILLRFACRCLQCNILHTIFIIEHKRHTRTHTWPGLIMNGNEIASEWNRTTAHRQMTRILCDFAFV